MSRIPSQGGFTIVETLVVLAVSSLLLFSAVLLIAGQTRKVEFNQAINDTQSIINQTISEVSSGFYPNGGNVKCTVSGTIMNISTVASGTPMGSNDGCIFLGKAIQFSDSGDASKYSVHSIAGLQTNDGTLATAKPQAINVTGSRIDGSLRNGLTVLKMRYVAGATTKDVSTVAFVNGLGTIGADSQLQSGAQQVAMVPVTPTTPVPGASVANTVSAIGNSLKNSDALLNPPATTSVQICLGNGSNQFAQITIGSNGRSLSVKLDVKPAVCW